MSAETDAFRAVMTEKASAKALALAAVGRAKLAELRGADASKEWAIVAEQGMSGVEGAKMAEAQTLADAYVAAHPEEFTVFESLALPGAKMTVIRDGAPAEITGQESLVLTKSFFKQSGAEEQATLLTMFELARFERQQIGVRAEPQLRLPRAGGKG